MADGVQQGHELTLLSEDMENQTDVEMAREDRGLMMSTEWQVNIFITAEFPYNPSPKGYIGFVFIVMVE